MNYSDERREKKILLHSKTDNKQKIFNTRGKNNPAYKISNEFSGGGVPSCKDGKWIWLSFNDGWEEVREMSQNEAKAFEIVRKYGKYNNSEVRM